MAEKVALHHFNVRLRCGSELIRKASVDLNRYDARSPLREGMRQ